MRLRKQSLYIKMMQKKQGSFTSGLSLLYLLDLTNGQQAHNTSHKGNPENSEIKEILKQIFVQDSENQFRICWWSTPPLDRGIAFSRPLRL